MEKSAFKAWLQKKKGKATACLATKDEQRIVAEGHLVVEATYTDGRKEILVDDHNMVVRAAEGMMAMMSLGLRTMNYIELGDPSPVSPPDLDDTALEQTTGERKAIIGSVSGNQALYEATWLTTDGNGFNFTESGLFTDPFGTGTLFARKTFSPISKNASFALTFKWAIGFRVADIAGGCTGVALLGSSTITQDYLFTAVGGETQAVLPIDFIVGGKQLDIFLNGQRLVYNAQYYESSIGMVSKGITLIGFTLKAGDEIYAVNRKLA
jgi:hypothetical protein